MRTIALFFAATAVWAIFAGCDSAPNSAYLPIGSRCSSAGQCGTRPFTCNAALPGGYCERDCTTDGDCPMDAVCVTQRCRRRCQVPNDCRVHEGYACRTLGATSPVCVAAPADAGP